jgi:hypothetical protein
MKSAWVKFAAIFGFWTLLALLLVSSNFLYRVSAGLPARYMAELGVDLLDYWIWPPLTPAIFYMAKRFPFSRRNWARTTIIHFGAYLVFRLAARGYRTTDRPTRTYSRRVSWIGLGVESYRVAL